MSHWQLSSKNVYSHKLMNLSWQDLWRSSGPTPHSEHSMVEVRLGGSEIVQSSFEYP